MISKFIDDPYSLKARTFPVLLALLPILIIGIFFPSILDKTVQIFGSLGLSIVLFFLFSQLGRDRGKNLEKEMWKNWGGMPTIQLFRFSNHDIDIVSKNRYHKKMKSLVETEIMPSKEMEKNNPNEVDDIYRAWTNFLIGKTRDTSKYDLLFKENINYGFRRNMLGLKPFAFIVILVLCFFVWGFNYFEHQKIEFSHIESLIAQSILLLGGIFWTLFVNEEWVKITAFAYAKQLLESIDNLDE